MAESAAKTQFSATTFAWTNGTLVASIWTMNPTYRITPIPADKEVDLSGIFEPADETELEQVFELFGQYSPWSLRNRTHDELPWKSTPRNHVIAPELMREYFSENYL